VRETRESSPPAGSDDLRGPSVFRIPGLWSNMLPYETSGRVVTDTGRRNRCRLRPSHGALFVCGASTKCTIHPHRALQAFIERLCDVLAWSFDLCEDGRHPSVGFEGARLDGVRQARAGQPLCGDGDPLHFACYCGWKGDRQARVKNHRLTRTWATTSVCELCSACIPYKGAVSKLLSFGDCTASAPRPQLP
jgi:hypothetical protein